VDLNGVRKVKNEILREAKRQHILKKKQKKRFLRQQQLEGHRAFALLVFCKKVAFYGLAYNCEFHYLISLRNYCA